MKTSTTTNRKAIKAHQIVNSTTNVRRGLAAALASALLICGSLLPHSAQALDKVTYYHQDALGSTIAASNEAGVVTWRERYMSYGTRVRREDAGSSSLWYTGKPEERDFGLQYFGARWYDSQLGQFLATDPVSFTGQNSMTFNRYLYANGNPYKFIDPDGREIVATNPNDQAHIAGYINKLSSGVFEFRNDRLVQVSATGGIGKSDYYTNQVRTGIDSPQVISIQIDTGPEVGTTPNGKDSVIQIRSETLSSAALTGSTNVAETPETQLAHELVEHAIPNLTGNDLRNTTIPSRENKVRRDNGLPQRSGKDHYYQ